MAALDRYWKKRDFHKTKEPHGDVGRSSSGRLFVVQKHAATRLHYDFRLELDGVLVSWAVPKGPSYDPADKRLAVRVEDHPIEYGDFEGVIPKGEYGGGAVVLWDRGTWTPLGDPHAMLDKGHLELRLDGEKLRGTWHLVRTRRGQDDKEQWILFKAKDELADPTHDVTGGEPASVVTGRTVEQVAKDADRKWSRRGEVAVERPPVPELDPSRLAGARKAAFPGWVEPELATLVGEAPEGDRWLHEIKYDGYRALARVHDGKATLWSRNGKDWTRPFAPIAAACRALPCDAAWIDGEVCVLRKDGRTDFQALQHDLGAGRTDRLVYFAFDLVHLDGWDLSRVPLDERKALLKELLSAAPSGPLRFSDHVVGHGREFFADLCRFAVEGSIAKRADAPYKGGRGRDWLKIKCLGREEVVIGGFTAPEGARKGFGALLVGMHDEDGRLVYVGRVGTGFDGKTLDELYARMKPLAQDESPFATPVPRPHARTATWIRPELVATVEFTEMTRDLSLRHPSFKGLREDVDPKDVLLLRPDHPNRAAPPEEDAPVAPKDEAKAEDVAPKPKRYRHRSGADVLEVAGVPITHPDRPLWKEQKVTKADLARYYAKAAERVLPYVADRPLTLVRCPNGVGKPCFFQKHAKETIPEAVRQVLVPEKTGKEPYLYVDSVAGLVSLVQMGTLEIHPWGARNDKLENPDLVTFDLDPDEGLPWSRVAEGARLVEQVLDALGLASYVKTTGGKGLHVCVPLSRRNDWDEVKAFAQAVATAIVAAQPDRYTAKLAKSERGGRVLVDWLRNARGATAVAAWSTRARPGATISTPLSWDEIDDVDPAAWNVTTIDERLRADDPWEGIFDVRQSITKTIRRSLRLP